jgi:hypothetical protein
VPGELPDCPRAKAARRIRLPQVQLKLQLKGSSPVNDATFTKLIGDLDESITGSDPSESEGEEADGVRSGDITLTVLLIKQEAA